MTLTRKAIPKLAVPPMALPRAGLPMAYSSSYSGPRFLATLTGTYPNQTLTIVDQSTGGTVLSSISQLHSKIDTGSALCDCTISVEAFSREVSTPDGAFTEEGCDLVFAVSNSTGSPIQVGKFKVNGWRLGSSLSWLSTWHYSAMSTLAADTLKQANYPGSIYWPGSVVRGTSYDVAQYMQYQPVSWDHPMKVYELIDSTTTPANTFGATFDAGNNDGTNIAMLAAGESRTYRLSIRIRDTDSVKVGGLSDGAGLWIYMLESYRRHLRTMFAAPDYSKRDARAVMTYALAQTSDQSSGNHRGWRSGVDPTTGTGYNDPLGVKLTHCVDRKLYRIMLTAISGLHYGGNQGNYPFRFASGVTELGGTAAATIEEAVKAFTASGIQPGMWWGNSFDPERATTWDGTPSGSDEMDPDDAALLAKGYLEGDTARLWGTQCIGLDLYPSSESPSNLYRYARLLLRRYPTIRFIAEAGPPDFLHAIMGGYSIEATFGLVVNPHWVADYLNPGNESWMQVNDSGVTGDHDRANEIAAFGYVPAGAWGSALDPDLRAAERWQEYGLSAVSPISTRDGLASRQLRLGRFGRTNR